MITVGGTNGKGSTVACLDALLRAAGLRCGRFTSPHLARYNERICVDGVEASDASLIESFERIDAARGDITLTFFEYNALAALDLFRRAASTWPCSRWAWADGWTPPTSSTRTSP